MCNIYMVRFLHKCYLLNNQKGRNMNPINLVLKSALVSMTMLGYAHAITINEMPDAGNTIATAMVLGAGVTSIQGTIASGQDTDLFQYTLGSDATLTIDMLFPGNDANLLVFNSLGQGLAGDDDDDSSCTPISMLDSLDSCLTLNLTAGVYYVGVGDNNIAAFESLVDFNIPSDFFDNDFGILSNPTPEIMALIGREGGPNSNGDAGTYTVNFSIASDTPVSQVPVPGSMLLIGLGLAGMLFRPQHVAKTA